MVSNNKVAEGLLKVFEHRQSFSVIGLTGRTGSGCSTIAGILGKERFTDIKLEPIEKSHDTAQQKRKERLVRDWFENEDNWNKFRIIQVSHVLLMLAMSQPQVDLVTLLRRELEDSGSNRKISVCMQSIDNTTVEFLPFGLDWTCVAEIQFSENKDLPNDNDPPRRQKVRNSTVEIS